MKINKTNKEHFYQKLVLDNASNNCSTKYIVACAGRESGKSHAAKLCLMNWAINISDASILWVTNNITQTKNDYKKIVEELTIQGLVKEKSENIGMLYCKLVNNTTIYFNSTNNLDSIVGLNLTHLILGEAAFTKYEVYSTILLPMLNTNRPGIISKILLISTPQGKNWFYDIFKKAQKCKDGSMIAIRWTSQDNPACNKNTLLMFKEKMNAEKYKQEILGKFIDK